VKAGGRPLGVVLGDLDLVSCLGMAGVRCVPVAPAGDIVHFSRFNRAVIETSAEEAPEQLVDRLRSFAQAQPSPPVLYYQDDEQLLLVSRHRNALREFYRYVLPDEELVEDLVNKVRFQRLAERLELQVPRTRILSPHVNTADIGNFRFPLVLKPSTREGLTRLPYEGKARAFESPSALRDTWPRLAEAGVDMIVQELITGPESRVESYHAYVDFDGAVVAEFTGAKIRTQPQTFGYSTAVQTTRADDVVYAGRGLARGAGFLRRSQGRLQARCRGTPSSPRGQSAFQLVAPPGGGSRGQSACSRLRRSHGHTAANRSQSSSRPHVVPARRRPTSRRIPGDVVIILAEMGCSNLGPRRRTVDRSYAAGARSAHEEVVRPAADQLTPRLDHPCS